MSEVQLSEKEWAVLVGDHPSSRASWPGPLTRLERLASRYGVDSREYRRLLREAVAAHQERAPERTNPHVIVR